MQAVLSAQLTFKPFIKWAGGKTQLLPALTERMPEEVLRGGRLEHYGEPFLGSGAVFLRMASLVDIKAADLNDTNPELFVVWSVVKRDVDPLIERLAELEARYHKMSDTERSAEFYRVRSEYNLQRQAFSFKRYHRASWVERAADMIYLNKTCFNGLFRVNRKGEFNVPAGRYRSPTICPEASLLSANAALQKATLHNKDFGACLEFCQEGSLVYFDPPYRPLTATSAFTSYTDAGFDDADQERLAVVCRKLDQIGASFILSNSDPRNVSPKDDFFDDLYAGFDIDRVPARRAINSKGTGRGAINELIIRNYS